MDKEPSHGLFGGVAEAIVLIIAVLLILAYYYSKYPTQFKNFFNTLTPTPMITQ